MAEYFGKGCEWLQGMWEDNCKEGEPVINCCSHPEQKDQYEGSCNSAKCPILDSYVEVLITGPDEERRSEACKRN